MIQMKVQRYMYGNRNMRGYRLLTIVILTVLALSSVNLLQGGDRIEIAMGYIPNVQFAPYYVALERGFFEDEGLEVTLRYGMSTDIMTLVAEGLVDFGISDGDQVILARDRGIPVKVVYTHGAI